MISSDPVAFRDKRAGLSAAQWFPWLAEPRAPVPVTPLEPISRAGWSPRWGRQVSSRPRKIPPLVLKNPDRARECSSCRVAM